MALNYPETVFSTSGLVRYWRLQETGNATVAVDETGSADGLAISGPAIGELGGLSNGDGLSYRFDGVNDFLDGGDIAAVKALAPPVYELVFYLPADHANMTLLCHGVENQQGKGYCQFWSGTFQFLAHRAGDIAALVVNIPESDCNVGGWNHVLWNAGRRYVVLNGAKKYLNGGFNDYPIVTSGTQRLVIGAYLRDVTVSRYYDGLVSEVAIYDATGNAGLNTQAAFNATALAHYQAMHTVFGEATIESDSQITARGGRLRTGGALIEGEISITAAGHRVHPPSAYPLGAVVPDSRTKAVLR